MHKIKNPLLRLALVLLALLNVLPQLSTAYAQGTAFTYNGLLEKGGVPQGGTFNFSFTLFNVASLGTAIAGPIYTTGVTVKNGAFTVTLDFGGAVWNGQYIWLEIAEEGPGETTYTPLMPRQQIMPTPYAIYAESANNLSSSLSFSQLTGTINSSQLANSFITVTTGTGLSGGTSVSLDNGSVNLINTGVTSLTGSDGVTVSGATGDLTLGLSSTLTLNGAYQMSINTTGGGSFFYADDGNLFAGLSAGGASVTGGANTGIGIDVLRFDTSGYGNTATGAQALWSNIGGAQNTADGYEALLSNTNGYYNTGCGSVALYGNVDGSYNTALGYDALGQLGLNTAPQGGTNNIAIGSGAGSAFRGVESSNIDIGNIGVLGENNITRIGTPGIQTAAYIAGIINGNGSGLTSLNASQITGGTILNSQLANSSITITPITGSGITGGGTVSLGGAVMIGSTATSLNTPNTIVSRDGTGSFAAQNLTLAGILNLPAPPVTINSGASSLLLGDANRDLFVGLGAGNLTSGAGDNTALGYESLQAVTTGYENVAVGSQSLAANTTGIYNTGVGYLALQQNTDGFGNTACGWESLKVNTDGWYDTGIGTWALQANTTGHNNTAVGYDALGGNTTGTENTAYGVHANLYNTTGSNNVAVGWWSLNYITSGVSNIAVGYQAGINLFSADSDNIDIGNAGVGGDDNTIRIGSVNNVDSNYVANTYIAGIWNAPVSSGLPVVVDSSGHLGVQPSAVNSTRSTADGYQALYSNPNGYQNTADGYQALYSDTTGGNNTAVGNSALVADTSGSANTACGNGALGGNTSGGYNTAVGEGALGGNSTGTFNTAVGVGALSGVTTGMGNIAIGADSGLQDGSYNIDIGNNGVIGDNGIIRIGNQNVNSDCYIAGFCHTEGYGCKYGISGNNENNAFNTSWDGSYIHLWIDYTDVADIRETSDRRLKENIQPMTDDALSRVMALKPSTFKYKNVPGTIFHGDGQTEEGFIADELQQVIPSAVNGEKDALTSKGTIQPQNVNLMPVVAVLTKAVQDQQKEIDELKAMVKTLSEKK